MSVKAFAKRLGVDLTAVQSAIKTGRLERSVMRNASGHPKIADVELAEREWRDNATYRRQPAPGVETNGVAWGSGKGTTAHERKLLIRAQRKRVNLDIAKRRGALVSAAEVETLWATRIVTCRTKLLGLVSRCQQRLPHLTAPDRAVIESLIREALEELAGAEGSEGEEAT